MVNPNPTKWIWRRRDIVGLGATTIAVGSVTAACDVFSTKPASERGGESGSSSTHSDQKEAPELAERVKRGELPPLSKRLPRNPLVIHPAKNMGRYGGTWHNWLNGPATDYQYSTAVGYDNLVRWNWKWTDIVPNVAESVEVRDDAQEFTFRLREGMRWSDGEPFTPEDLRFALEEVFKNSDIYPAGAPSLYTVGDRPAELEIVDDQSVRFKFPGKQSLFLDRHATAEGRSILMPKHYLKKFHKNYNKNAETLAKDQGFDSWADLFQAKNDTWQNPERPVLDAWSLIRPAGKSSSGGLLRRNPFYWKTDPNGRQLPYIDQVTYPVISSLETVLLRLTNGDIDFQYPYYAATACTPTNKPMLARNRKKGSYRFIDSTSSLMNQMIIALNLTHEDPAMRSVFQNRDFRVGLSYALNRKEIAGVIFQHLGQAWQAAPRKDSKVYDRDLAKQFTEYDLERANKHLDQAGYAQRDSGGFRLRPDGKRIGFLVDVATEMSELINALELVRKYWRAVGVDVHANTMDRQLFYERKAANKHDANVWSGDGGWRDAILDPRWYFPYSAESNFATPWAAWYGTGGKEGEKPPAPARQQMNLYDELKGTSDRKQQREIFGQILSIAREQFWVIGTVLDEGMYGTVQNGFENVPDWMPGSWLYPTPGPTAPEQYWVS